VITPTEGQADRDCTRHVGTQFKLMATWTNKTKNIASFVNKAVRGKWKWSDQNALWSDARFTWGGVGTVIWTNRDRSRNPAIVTDNQFFGWLFWFTQSTNDPGDTAWHNKTKH
jgi:hypothetical protein